MADVAAAAAMSAGALKTPQIPLMEGLGRIRANCLSN
jgi:hypothetical protein